MNINEKIAKKNNLLSIEELFLLWALETKCSWIGEFNYWPSTHYKLHQLKFIENEKVLKKGREYLIEVGLLNNKPSNTLDIDAEFKLWWETYPGYDDHGQWSRTRRIKTNKTRSKQLYYALIEEGVNSKLLLAALEDAIEFEKKNSIKENKLKYFPNPARWLFQRDFEDYKESKSEDIISHTEYGKSIE